MRRRILLALATAIAACAPSWKQGPHDRRFQRAEDPRLHRRPAGEWLPIDWFDRAMSSTFLPMAHVVSPARWLGVLTGGREALDVNDFGEVPDSAWFENRIARRAVSDEELARGPGESAGPAPGLLTVVSGKLEGSTPGMVVRDAAGVTWYLKFDPPAFPEMSTGAEIVAQRILYAIGYHVPEMQVIDMALDRLVLDPRAKRRNDYDELVPLTKKDLSDLLLNLNPTPSRRIRTLVSRQVDGELLGPFPYRGIRVDDPNDLIPHERRRSLRGLWLFSAWLNNTDVRRQNTLDSFIVADGKRHLGYVRHHLIDFGDALGSSGDRGKYIGEGYEGYIDWPRVIGRFFGLGAKYPYWVAVRRSLRPAVGVFEADVFDPARWTPDYPNPAFDEATARDTFWAAAIMARFDRERVSAVVGAARYSDPKAAQVILDVLMKRRDKLLVYAFRRMAPLGDPEARGTRLWVRDLEEMAGLPVKSGRSYRVDVSWNRGGRPDCPLEGGTLARPEIDLAGAIARARAQDAEAFRDEPFFTVTWRRRRHGRDGPAVEVHVRVAGDRVIPVAVWREVE